MISVDAAGLIAQVYPVFILLLMLEGWRIARSPTRSLAASYLDLALFAFSTLTLAAAIPAVSFAVLAVISDEEMSAGLSSYVKLTGLALYAAVLVLNVRLIGPRLNIFLKNIDDAKRLRAAESPARHD